MKKTHLILFVAFLILNSVKTEAKKLASKKNQKPNIIFILTDDQRWDALGFSGNRIIKTPEMDKLAREGVYFKNAFVTTPICAASRASIFTSLYERTHGYTFGQGNIKDPYINNSYPALMKKSDYYTGFFGKFGVQYEHISSLFDDSEVYDRNGKYSDYRGYYYKTLGRDTVHLTRYTGQKAMDFINNAPSDKPFCLSLSFSAPHAHDPAPNQYFWQDAQDSLYRDMLMPPPLLGADKYFNEQPDYVKENINRKRWHWRYDTFLKYQHSVKGYYRMIRGIDREIGKIRTLLKEKGIADNTIIMLMGDNGYFLGERQLAGKWLMYDNSLRVPLIIYDPRNENHRVIVDMALNIDIAPTIFDFAGLDVSSKWQGRSLAGYVKGENPVADREQFVCEHLWETPRIPPSEGLRTKKWKYFRYRRHLEHEELYNLVEDPLEKNNLAKDEKYQSKLEEMRSNFKQLSGTLKDQKVVQ